MFSFDIGQLNAQALLLVSSLCIVYPIVSNWPVTLGFWSRVKRDAELCLLLDQAAKSRVERETADDFRAALFDRVDYGLNVRPRTGRDILRATIGDPVFVSLVACQAIWGYDVVAGKPGTPGQLVATAAVLTAGALLKRAMRLRGQRPRTPAEKHMPEVREHAVDDE